MSRAIILKFFKSYFLSVFQPPLHKGTKLSSVKIIEHLDLNLIKASHKAFAKLVHAFV